MHCTKRLETLPLYTELPVRVLKFHCFLPLRRRPSSSVGNRKK